ncbi:MAG: class II fructose-bisphosphate aldolase [Proteobacteria bacterium]|nr:class II fructose-bisphosphate aldolase [Pseudomonadota bacterium]
MELFDSIGAVYRHMDNSVEEARGGVQVFDADRLRETDIDGIIYNAVFNTDEEIRDECRRVIRLSAADIGTRSASIQGLYDAMGARECGGFTVPAINIRGLTYDVARAIFRSAKKHNSGAFLFEIAKSEIGYTEQRPAEYTACCLAAAIKEGWTGPVFIQADHFQVNASAFAKNPAEETAALKTLISEALDAQFYNIDIDASTTVDLSKATIKEQQTSNYEMTALLTEHIRANEPAGVTVSVGGEIGEVGKKNSTEEELRAFMDGYKESLKEGTTGISKISIQTGTSHGGVALPDGSIASVKVDFDTIEKLDKISKDDYGLGGVVQHGASTLPDDAFHVFPERGTAEVHLATGFQNMIYDSANFPAELKEAVYAHLKEQHSGERKEEDTDEQFYYKTRKKGFGPFKKQMWDLGDEVIGKIGAELEERFDSLFTKLNAVENMESVTKTIK